MNDYAEGEGVALLGENVAATYGSNGDPTGSGTSIAPSTVTWNTASDGTITQLLQGWLAHDQIQAQTQQAQTIATSNPQYIYATKPVSQTPKGLVLLLLAAGALFLVMRAK